MPIRLCTRAIIVEDDRLLLVNAFPGDHSDLWCAPGGGAEPGQSLHENLVREVHEETGLTVSVGALCLVNEFHSPETGYHQVDLFFRCTVTSGTLSHAWKDPEAVVHTRRYMSQTELENIRLKPDSLRQIMHSENVIYDPLEVLLKE